MLLNYINHITFSITRTNHGRICLSYIVYQHTSSYHLTLKFKNCIVIYKHILNVLTLHVIFSQLNNLRQSIQLLRTHYKYNILTFKYFSYTSIYISVAFKILYMYNTNITFFFQLLQYTYIIVA